MSKQPYDKPPITEAVIDIQFDGPVEGSAVSKAVGRFAEVYPNEEVVKNLEFQFDIDAGNLKAARARVDEQLTVHKRTTNDQSELALLSPVALTISQLAPYPGWDDFFGRFNRDWREWKAAVGYKKIRRIGVRYINRLDIPAVEGKIEVKDYLQIYVEAPSIIEAQTVFAVLVESPLPEISSIVRLNTASVPSPLMDHVSLLLDIDVMRISDVPQNDTDLMDYLVKARGAKNAVFEGCVTDSARKLF